MEGREEEIWSHFSENGIIAAVRVDGAWVAVQIPGPTLAPASHLQE